MHHGQRLVLLVYLHLTLEIQYNTILIIINSIYIILLFANKQWGTIAQKDAGNTLYTNINFNTSGWAGILAEIADTNKERVSFGAFRFISKSTYIINSISITSDKSIWYGNRTWFYYIAIGK